MTVSETVRGCTAVSMHESSVCGEGAIYRTEVTWQAADSATVCRPPATTLTIWQWSKDVSWHGVHLQLAHHSQVVPPIAFFMMKLLSLRFIGHFPGESGLAGVYWSKGRRRWWRQLDYWSYKSCKASVKSSPPTNQHPVLWWSLHALNKFVTDTTWDYTDLQLHQ